jgi:hypothetical protein
MPWTQQDWKTVGARIRQGMGKVRAAPSIPHTWQQKTATIGAAAELQASFAHHGRQAGT